MLGLSDRIKFKSSRNRSYSRQQQQQQQQQHRVAVPLQKKTLWISQCHFYPM